MKADDIKKLIEKYYAGETTLDEEESLREFFADEEKSTVDPEFAELVRLFHHFEGIEYSEDAYQISEQKENKDKVYSLPWYYSAAASIIFLMAGVLLGNNFQTKEDEQITRLSDEIKEMKTMMNYQKVRDLSPTDKIQIAYEVQQFDSTDYKSIDVLIELMHFDENINVRLAATEALTRFGKSEKVRDSLIEALKKETDPVIQIKIIDALVRSKEIKALPQFQKIIDSENINSAVKQRAALGMNQLI